MRRVIAGLASLVLVPVSVFAQPPALPDVPGNEPPTVSFVTGLSVGSSEVGPLAGGSLSAGVTTWLSLEGWGGFTDRGPGVNGVYAIASAVFNALPASRRVVPFATIGGGLYHAAIDMDNQDMFGSITMTSFNRTQTMVMIGNTSAMTGVIILPRPTQMPMAYATRMGVIEMPGSGKWGHRSFTDPAMSVGGGAAIRLSRNVVLRPDARALMVFSGGETYTIGLIDIGIGFRF